MGKFSIVLGLMFAVFLTTNLQGVSAQALDARSLRTALDRAITAEERLRVLAKISTVDDPRLVEVLLKVLEKTETRIGIAWKRLGQLEKLLEPVSKELLSDEEWKERDRLTKERVLAGNVLSLEESVAEKLVELLSTTSSGEVVRYLRTKGLRIKSALTRVRVVEALGTIADDACLDGLMDALRDKDSKVRSRAADLLGERRVKKAVTELSRAALEDKVWQVRSAAIAALVRIGDNRAIEPLISIVGREEGKLLDDALAGLERLTGKKFGTNYLAWRDWLKEHIDSTAGTILDIDRPLPPKARGDRLTYQGIETHSKGVLFIFDISDSMNDPAGQDILPEAGVPDRDSGLRSKLDVAREDLINAILGLNEASRFSVILYNHEVHDWRKKMIGANKSNKNMALKFVLEKPAVGGTNIFDSLELAFNIAGFGAQDKNYKSAVDTIFLLTDGLPSAGRIIDTDRILLEVDRMNRLRKIRIHVIGVGALNDTSFLRELAKRNGGKFIEKR